MLNNDEHRILEYVDHLSAYIGGVVAVTGAMITFWWRDRATTRHLIDSNHKENQVDHAKIIEKMNDQHAETLNTILDLHKSD